MPVNTRIVSRPPRLRPALFLLAAAAAALSLAPLAAQTPPPPGPTLRATLPNGLRVVIIRNALAPVATVELNVLAGGDETSPQFPGMAHAQEHMAFRGCPGLTGDQTAAVYAELGGENDADTQQNITQFFATVPAADLEVALRAQAACLRGMDDSQAQWAQERGAIEQEVARDLSNPTYNFLVRLDQDMFAGTPYAHDPLGTKPSFDATSAAMLRAFHAQWYTPANMILVVVGAVDPAAALARIRTWYGGIPSHPLPARPAVALRPVKSESFTLASNLPYVLGFLAYRLPGTDSPDYAASEILADVLGSQRGHLYGLVPAGKALDAEFGLAETYRKASVGYGVVAVPRGTAAAGAIHDMRTILATYAQRGVPADLVAAAKRGEVAAAEFQRNSIPGLANVWSNALAAEGRTSPDQDVAAIQRVTLADVDRVARQYLVAANSITATLNPVPTGQPVAEKGYGGGEAVTSPPTKPVALPPWAAGALARLQAPPDTLALSDSTLPNGLRLIVKTDRTSPTVTVVGGIRHNPGLQTPPGHNGAADLLDGLFSYGTQTLDRLAFQKALDDIAANENAGYGFSLQVLRDHFSRGVQLLADNELHPALPAPAFAVVRRQTEQFVAGNLKSPAYRAGRALDLALLPAGDPALRQATPATLASDTLGEVRQYQAATMRPDLATIVVVGDVSPQEARNVIARWFGGWQAAGPPPNTTLPAVPVNRPAVVTVPDPERVQDSVVLAEQLHLNRFDPDYYPLQLGDHVLGGGFYATRLYHDLRQVNGYVYSVGVSLEATKTRATYFISYGCSPANVLKARALIQRDLAQMGAQDVSAGELQQAKALLLRQIPLSESSEDAVAAGLLGRAQQGLPLDEPTQAAKQYLALSADQVRAAFAREIRAGGFVQVVRGPAPH